MVGWKPSEFPARAQPTPNNFKARSLFEFQAQYLPNQSLFLMACNAK